MKARDTELFLDLSLRRMTPEHWHDIERLYHAALEREPSQREIFLRDATAGDDNLLREVQELLAQDDDTSEAFLKLPPTEVLVRTMAGAPPPSLIGQRVGPFDILSQLGSGGWGDVYRARDSAKSRDVAVKVLRPVMASNQE